MRVSQARSAAQVGTALVCLFMSGCIVVTSVGSGNRTTSANSASAPGTAELTVADSDGHSGWQPLFDGKSLDGWTTFADGDSATTWSARDGSLICSGSPVGYIKTARSFRDFELCLEWRFDPNKGAGNSGVLLRVEGADQVWPRSIEAQLHSENAGDIWNIGEFPMQADSRRTEGRRTVKAHPTNEVPLGEWNRYDIRLVGERLELRVNGDLQNVALGCKGGSGPIALQAEGAHIEFRNIRVRELK